MVSYLFTLIKKAANTLSILKILLNFKLSPVFPNAAGQQENFHVVSYPNGSNWIEILGNNLSLWFLEFKTWNSYHGIKRFEHCRICNHDHGIIIDINIDQSSSGAVIQWNETNASLYTTLSRNTDSNIFCYTISQNPSPTDKFDTKINAISCWFCQILLDTFSTPRRQQCPATPHCHYIP